MSFIELNRDGHLATVTINRPERRNAVTLEMMQDLERISREFLHDEQTRVVIVRAEGKDFSVGADLSNSPSQRLEASMLMRRRGAEFGAQLMRSMQEIPQPTICAVQGIATGAGGCITSACDFRVGADNARVGYGEVKLGINLMWHAVPICVHLVGPARAKQMIMTGKLFDAATLERWGFLDQVVPLVDLDAAAREMAEVYAALPPNSVQMIKKSINHVAGALDRAVMHMDADQWLLSSLTEDYKEAVSAFFAKRPPKFTGN
ncbi:enoyl-CoA hydratase/isomerase family protein [Phenylobacterium sp.]|uniref:enoyl-CoA hydratase/isomerase family protein n=1 Tax=Phenylobacterium sp. TaxID=1871053 RepID=UPI00301DAC35